MCEYIQYCQCADCAGYPEETELHYCRTAKNKFYRGIKMSDFDLNVLIRIYKEIDNQIDLLKMIAEKNQLCTLYDSIDNLRSAKMYIDGVISNEQSNRGL